MGKAGKITEMLEDRLCARVVRESEVYERVVCERGVCVHVCARVVCARKSCVCETVVCEAVVCHRVVCERAACVRVVFGNVVKELCDNVAPGGQEEDVAAARYRAEKQEPRTMMWGTQPAFNVTTENHQACSWF